MKKNEITVLVISKVTENMGLYHMITNKEIWVEKGLKVFKCRFDWNEMLTTRYWETNVLSSVKDTLAGMSNENVKYDLVQHEIIFSEIPDLTDKITPILEAKIAAMVIS